MKNLSISLKELNTLIEQFRFEEALEKFYDEGVVTCENENPPIVGLQAYRIAAKSFAASISNYSAELKNIILSDNMSVIEWHYIFDHQQWGHWDRYQLSVQRWKDGKIIHERHHYNM